MSVPQLLGYATHVVSKMTDNAYFTAPNPQLVKVTAVIADLQNAFNNALGAGPAQTATMNQFKDALQVLMNALANYVESIANDPANVNTGADAVILSAGMDVKSTSPHQKQTFTVSYGNIPGSVDLTGASITRGSHEWEYKTDATNANEWISAEPTVQASTTIHGLEISKRYYFRHRSITTDGPTDWDDPLSLIVV